MFRMTIVFRFFPAVLSALLLLAGCSHGLQTRTYSSDEIVEAGVVDASCRVSISSEYITGGVDREVMDRINGSIIERHILFDEAAGAVDVPAACRKWVEATRSDYTSEIEELTEGYGADDSWRFDFSFELQSRFGAACASRHLQTYSSDYSEYTGGAHGLRAVTFDVYDLTTGALVPEQDLFADGSEDGLSELLFLSLEAYLEREGSELDVMLSMPGPNGNFSVSEEGVTWCYNPYEIAPYSMGCIELTVRWADLKPYLRRRG